MEDFEKFGSVVEERQLFHLLKQGVFGDETPCEPSNRLWGNRSEMLDKVDSLVNSSQPKMPSPKGVTMIGQT